MKKLLAIAIATMPAAAMAEVTLYGKMGAEVGYHKTLDSGIANDPNGSIKGGFKVDGADSPRIGFKGSEDLGNGLKAIWQVEQGIKFDNGGSASGNANRFATRDSFIGLSGDFGKIRVGRLSNYQNSDMEFVDPWMYAGGVNGLGIFTRNDGRYDNAIRYDSPDFNGFNFAVVYGADENRAYVGGKRTNKQTLNLGLGYSQDAFKVGYSYIVQYDTGANADKKDQSHRLEAAYEANDVFVALGYQQVRGYDISSYNEAVYKLVSGAERSTSKEATLTVGTTVGAFTPRLSYVKGWDLKTGSTKLNDTGYQQFVVGADYELSKRTSAYASFGQVKWDSKISGDEDKERSFGVGLVHNF